MISMDIIVIVAFLLALGTAAVALTYSLLRAEKQ
jgi:hypothetical protein